VASCFDRVLASRLGKSRGVIARRKIKLYGWYSVTLTSLEQAIKGKTMIDRELLSFSDIMST
jgi:6-phosphofructokinase 1